MELKLSRKRGGEGGEGEREEERGEWRELRV